MTEESVCEQYPYHIPRIYIEGAESEEYIVQEDDSFTVSKTCPPGRKCYGKAIYGSILEEIVDIFSKRAEKSFIVLLPPSYTEGVLVEQGTYLEPIPVEGSPALLNVCEGEEVGKGKVIGLALTGKGEQRKTRAHVEGIVVYVYNPPDSKPEQYIVLIAPAESVKRVRIR